MSRFKLVILGLLLPLVMANQCSTAVKHAAIRTASAPYHALKGIYSAITPDKYKALVNEEKSLKLSSERIPYCPETKLPNSSSVDGLSDLASGLDSQLCSECVPWARVSAPAPFCSPSCSNACEKVCPQEGLGILDRYKEKVLPNPKDKLSFRNTNSMFKDADSALIPFQGYCSGMVSSRRKFNMNGFFEPLSVPRDRQGNVMAKDSPELISYYKDIIEKIHDNEPTEIPGYKNLGDFTNDPMIQDIMRQEIADEWADVTVMRSVANSTALYGPLGGQSKVSNKKADEVISGLQEKIENVGSGTLYIGLGGSFNMHIIDAFAVLPPKGKNSTDKAKICINDPNYAGVGKRRGHTLSYKNGELINCTPSVTVKKNGEMTYMNMNVTDANVDHKQDEAAVTKSVARLKSFCKTKKNPPCKV